jgi:IS30 family transposase
MRPKIVERRTRIGDWEGDSIVSRRSKVALNTLVERKTGLVFITRIMDGTALSTKVAVTRRLRILPISLRHTLTVDNGSENSCTRELEEALDIDCYHAHPYASWERGTNENTNGLIRWYLPKGTDFALVSDAMINDIETALNNRPRKRLGWKTPLQALSGALRS